MRRMLWRPRIIVALVVLVTGGLFAQALSKVVRGVAAKSVLAKVAARLVWAFAIVVAVNTLFMAVAGAVALAPRLAAGLGRRETAAELVRNWFATGRQSQENSKKLARAAGEAEAGSNRKAGP